jgi:hypothetical protein
MYLERNGTMAKAYWIDSENKSITEVESSSLADMRRHIGGHIEIAFLHPNGDVLYVDEEGLLKNPEHWFRYSHRTDQPFAGNGLLVGREVEGDEYPEGFTTLSPKTSLADFTDSVTFGRNAPPRSRNEFSVYQWFPNDDYEIVAKFVPIEEAMRLASMCCKSVGAKIGTTRQVMITDGGDCCVFEWKFGEGVVFPPMNRA